MDPKAWSWYYCLLDNDGYNSLYRNDTLGTEIGYWNVTKGLLMGLSIYTDESNIQIVSENLTEDNFHAWKFRITNYLKGKGYWDYIKGANEAPPVILDMGASAKQVKSLKNWHQGSAKVMYWLSVSVSNSIVGHIQDADSPKDAWDNLIAFSATNTRARKIQLKNELNTIKKGDLSMNDYTLKIKALCESLSSIGVTMNDDDKVEASSRS
ncbi:hypothetical protein L7F22_066669 [Adiantum nelumboides]|nr:hypothetical protein [Adiantum nelumboides]